MVTMGEAVGLIEVKGLAAAVEAADAAAKAADVVVVGWEKTKGSGLLVVKFRGEVGAVRAALEAAEVASKRLTSVFASKLIPRPDPGIEAMLGTD
jgi:ethanolamine utilization protein EutM